MSYKDFSQEQRIPYCVPYRSAMEQYERAVENLSHVVYVLAGALPHEARLQRQLVHLSVELFRIRCYPHAVAVTLGVMDRPCSFCAENGLGE